MFFKAEHISRSFGKDEFSLSGISFSISSGEILALLGESGSGKTTLLRILAGFELPDSGTIHLDGKTIVDQKTFVHPEERKTGLVFQEHALFPHLTVEKNILYGIRQGADRERKLTEMLSLTGLKGMEKRYPHELSGGQQQRVAIARSLAAEPSLLLLDEPFSNLDDSIKTQVRTEIRGILKQSGIASIFVTHDTQDCLAVADQILILKNGKMLQSGTPEQIYHQPATAYIARLFGPVNEFSQEERVSLNLGDTEYLVRPEYLQLNTEKGIDIRVIDCYFAGSHYVVIADTGKRIIEAYHHERINIGSQLKISRK